jgi:hypothetical protein
MPMAIDFGFYNPTTLSVNLLNFNAKQVDEQINLTWKTANEKDFSHFELQRSTDAKEFGSIAKVTGNKASIYNHTDVNPSEGINYYRLKMVDLDGKSTLSDIVSVTFEKGANFVSVENPANNGEFKVMTNLKNPRFTLLTTFGSKVETNIVSLQNNIYAIKAMNTSAGMYYLNIEANGKFITKKVLMP